jgi:hypothetical protein
VTPKQGTDPGGLAAVRKLRLVILCAVLIWAGTIMRLLDLGGWGPLPDLPGIAAFILPALGLIELRRLTRTLVLVGRRKQRRLVYRFQGDAPAHVFTPEGPVIGRLVDASASGLGLVMEAPLPVGAKLPVGMRLHDSLGVASDVSVTAEVRSCRARRDGGEFMVGTRIASVSPEARLALMEWCYVVCSHEMVRGARPGTEPSVAEPVAVLEDGAPGAVAAPVLASG